jgi:hypothetical protein
VGSAATLLPLPGSPRALLQLVLSFRFRCSAVHCDAFQGRFSDAPALMFAPWLEWLSMAALDLPDVEFPALTSLRLSHATSGLQSLRARDLPALRSLALRIPTSPRPNWRGCRRI